MDILFVNAFYAYFSSVCFRSGLRCGFVNHLIQIRTSVRVRKSFDSDRDFGAGS